MDGAAKIREDRLNPLKADNERLERLVREIHEIVLREGSGDEKLLLIRSTLAVNGYF